QQAALGEGARAAGRVLEVRVAAVDHDVARLQVGHEGVEHEVDGGAGAHHQHHAPRAGQRRRQGGEVGEPLDVAAGTGPGEEVVHDVRLAVVDGDAVSLVAQVQREVLAHHAQADHGDVGEGGGPDVPVAGWLASGLAFSRLHGSQPRTR